MMRDCCAEHGEFDLLCVHEAFKYGGLKCARAIAPSSNDCAQYVTWQAIVPSLC